MCTALGCLCLYLDTLFVRHSSDCQSANCWVSVESDILQFLHPYVSKTFFSNRPIKLVFYLVMVETLALQWWAFLSTAGQPDLWSTVLPGNSTATWGAEDKTFLKGQLVKCSPLAHHYLEFGFFVIYAEVHLPSHRHLTHLTFLYSNRLLETASFSAIEKVKPTSALSPKKRKNVSQKAQQYFYFWFLIWFDLIQYNLFIINILF